MCYHSLKMDKLASIYYQPSHLWKGQQAIKKLRELRKEKLKVVKQWLVKHAIWQVHSLPPKHINRPHYEVMIPNEMPQFDLLYMPTNTLHGNEYKYILSGINVTYASINLTGYHPPGAPRGFYIEMCAQPQGFCKTENTRGVGLKMTMSLGPGICINFLSNTKIVNTVIWA